MKVSTDRPALLVPSGIYMKVSPHSFYYGTSPAPLLLSSRDQHLELGRVSHVVSGMKAAPADNTQQLSEVRL